MKRQVTIFKCDECEVESKPVESFPYKKNGQVKGWEYLYQFSGKIFPTIEMKITDKHFCSRAHMLDYIGVKLYEHGKKWRKELK